MNFRLFPDLPILFFSVKIKSSEASFEIFFEEKTSKDKQKLHLEFRQWPNGNKKCVWHLDVDEENKKENVRILTGL